MVPSGSPAAEKLAHRDLRAEPAEHSTRPIRVGLRPTSSIVISDPEGPPRRPSRTPLRRSRRARPTAAGSPLSSVHLTVRPSTRDGEPERREGPLGVIARLRRSVTEVVPSREGPPEDRAFHLGAGDLCAILDRSSVVPCTAAGMASVDSMRAPKGDNGSITRRIGRRDSAHPRSSASQRIARPGFPPASASSFPSCRSQGGLRAN